MQYTVYRQHFCHVRYGDNADNFPFKTNTEDVSLSDEKLANFK